MKWFISYSQRFFFPWCECCRGEVHYNISFGVGASQIPRKIGVTHRGFCHGVYPWKGETNGWLVVWNMNFMTSLRVGMFFFQSDFHSIIFQGGCFTKPHKQPTRWWFSMIFWWIKAWHHGRMGPWIARTLHPSSRMSTVGGSTRRTAAMSTVGEAPQLD